MAMEDVFSRARANYECKVNGKSKKIGPGHNKVGMWLSFSLKKLFHRSTIGLSQG